MSAQKWHLRRAIAEDAGRINELFIEMLQTIHGKQDVQGYADGDIDYYFAGGEDWICIAEADDGVVGFLAMEVHRDVPEHVYLDDLSITAAYRGRGIGSALLRRAESYAKEIGFSVVALHVEKTNVNARRLYERMGYVQYRDEGHRCCMIKNL